MHPPQCLPCEVISGNLLVRTKILLREEFLCILITQWRAGCPEKMARTNYFFKRKSDTKKKKVLLYQNLYTVLFHVN